MGRLQISWVWVPIAALGVARGAAGFGAWYPFVVVPLGILAAVLVGRGERRRPSPRTAGDR